MLKKLIILIVLVAVFVSVMNIPLTSRQGKDGRHITKSIPLYAKVSGFLFRDYEYRNLSRSITKNIEGDLDKVLAIYNWTIKHIKRPPKELKVVDDHIWDIIVRGYGTGDQMADVFTTLTSYAGYDAFWHKISIDSDKRRLILSFVKIGDTWHIFDVLNNRYFRDKKELDELTPYGPTYYDYIRVMDKNEFEPAIRRPDKQKIIPRLIFVFQKIFTKAGNEDTAY